MNCTYFIKISEWESISLTFHDIDIACDVSATDKGDYLEVKKNWKFLILLVLLL